MRQRHDSSDQPPRREELAAYFDRELSGPRRRQVEEWLAHHPDCQADLEEWRQLAEVAHSGRPADPGEPAWAGVFERIEAATRPSRSQWARRALVGAAALAAALLLALLLPPRPAGDDAEPLEVASADDIEIISIDAEDVPALVVGHAPLREPLVLADSTDINVEHVEADPDDGMMPSIRWWTGVEAPMIVATLSPEPEPEP